MTKKRLPRTVLLFAALAITAAVSPAQRGGGAGHPSASGSPRPSAGVSAAPRPSMPAPSAAPRPSMPAPRPQAPSAAPRSFPSPAPSSAPRSFPSATPRSFPSATPRSPEPRSTPAPFPRSTPNPLPRQPGQDPSRSAPRSAPRPIDDGRYRIPGDTRSAPRSNPAPLPNSGDSSPSLPRGVGGSVRTVDRGAKSRSDGPALQPRDIYDDTMARPKPSGMPQPKAGDRPTTTRSIADRYSVDPRVRSKGTPTAEPLD